MSWKVWCIGVLHMTRVFKVGQNVALFCPPPLFRRARWYFLQFFTLNPNLLIKKCALRGGCSHIDHKYYCRGLPNLVYYVIWSPTKIDIKNLCDHLGPLDMMRTKKCRFFSDSDSWGPKTMCTKILEAPTPCVKNKLVYFEVGVYVFHPIHNHSSCNKAVT